MASAAPSVVLEARSLVREYPARGRLTGGRAATVRAVDDVSLHLDRGEMVGLLGRSGAGKSTLARLLAELEPADRGEVLLHGRPLGAAGVGPRGARRRAVQVVFQDPGAALDPRQSIGSIVAEPLVVHRTGSRAARRARVEELLALVGLEPALASRYPHEFSGGQRQRIAIARALALEPALVVADEPVAALDASLQAQIVNLLMDLQARLGLTYLLVSHDLRLVRHVCDRVAVMYLGRIVEMAPAGALFAAPRHPYTQALLSASPSVDPGAAPRRIVFDPRAFDPHAALRQVAEEHWVAG